ncbi:MAG: IS3 family transposase, partial [Deltaproteobacteria bacterium]|jgi:putative transposase|nr:IS3 family transposase [Deltaproteobacteria bacterium]
LEGREKKIFKERDEKLETAREQRKQNRREEKLYPFQHWSSSKGMTINPLTQQGQFSISS